MDVRSADSNLDSFGHELWTRVRGTESHHGQGQVQWRIQLAARRVHSYGGQDLTNGDFRPAQNVRGFAPLPAVSYSSLTLNMSSDTLVVFGHAGVTDDLDVGVAIPWVRVSLDATGGFFDSSGVNLSAVTIPATSASGIGDIAIFGKYRLWQPAEGGVSAVIELRLPTGDEDNLRGLGVTRTLIGGVWSQGGRIAPHANIGYEFWSDSVAYLGKTVTFSQRTRSEYAVGVELEAHPRATVIIDLVARHLFHGGKVGYQTFAGPGGSSIDALIGLPEGIQQLALAPGVKWNVWGSVLATANVLTALTNDGLRANIIPVVGLDWAF